MSGPKVSIYELNAHDQQIIRGQLRCEQQAVMCAHQIREALHQAMQYTGEIQHQIALTDMLISRCAGGQDKKRRLEDLLVKLERETSDIMRLLNAQNPQMSAKYRVSEAAYAQKKQKLSEIQAVRQRIVALTEEADAIVAEGMRGNDEATTEIQKSIGEDLGGYISFDIQPEPEDPDAELEKSTAEMRRKLMAMLGEAGCAGQLADEISAAIKALDRITDKSYAHTFNSITIQSLARKVAALKKEQAAREQAFREELERYAMLCSIAQVPAQKFEFSDAAFAGLEEENKRLEAVLVKQQEQAYISDCVNNVMAEMNYDLIGSRDVIKKKSGKHFRNELYKFGDGTAINVTFSSDGQISMELGGIAREDRIPGPAETEQLTGAMQSFCGEFAEFERRLRQKGVLINRRIALSPPSADYAAIININDYDIAASAQITEMQTAAEGRDMAKKKMLRSDE